MYIYINICIYIYIYQNGNANANAHANADANANANGTATANAIYIYIYYFFRENAMNGDCAQTSQHRKRPGPPAKPLEDDRWCHCTLKLMMNLKTRQPRHSQRSFEVCTNEGFLKAHAILGNGQPAVCTKHLDSSCSNSG